MAETAQTQIQGKEHVVVNNALITPSASPPLRSGQFKSTSRPPPKRARTGSFSSSPGPSNRTSSSSSRPATIDPSRDEAWRASSRRLLDVWESLAERYNVPLDQDDIIDLRTIELVKDRGVVRGLKKSLSIGSFGAQDPDGTDGDAASEDGTHTEPDDRDEDLDEIDSFVQEPLVPVKIELEKSNRHVPPFRAGDPVDDQDLKEFLEEEERRKARGGGDLDDDKESELIDLVDLISSDEGSEHSSAHNGRGAQYGRIGPGLSRWSRPPMQCGRVISEHALEAPEGDSEDEIATNWEDSTFTRRTSRASSGANIHKVSSDSAAPLSPPCPVSEENQFTAHTSPSPPPKPLHARTRSISRPRRGTMAPPSARNIQLQTPPLSHTASSVSEGPPDHRYTRAGSSLSSPRRLKTGRAQSSPIASSFPTDLPSPSTVAPNKREKTPYVLKHKMEVVMTTRRPRQKSPITLQPVSEPEARRAASPNQVNIPKTTPPGKINGRVKAIDRVLALGDISDNELPTPPPPRAKSVPRLAFSEISDSELPSPVKRTPAPRLPPSSTAAKRFHKRKRSSTSSSAFQTSPEHSPKSQADIPRDAPQRSEPSYGTIRGKGKGRAVSYDSDSEPPEAIDNNRNLRPSKLRSSVQRSGKPSSPSRSLPYPPPMFPMYPLPRHEPIPSLRYPQHPPFPPTHDPPAQHGFAQAVQYLSYLFAGGTGQLLPHHPFAYPSTWPQIPKHHSRARTRDSSTPPPRSSSPALSHSYETPSHRYSGSYDAYSSAASPPASSSPAPSSPTPSGFYHVPNETRRSKSRARKVSFKFGSDDERHLRFEGRETPHAASHSNRSNKVMPPPAVRRSPQKQRSDFKESFRDVSSEEDSSSWQRRERGRTPGPSSRRAKSKSTR